jgi:broad specificity phosphatase PhoE
LVTVILVRHGETEWNQIRRIQGGNSDTELNKRGKQQAESVASHLKQEPIQAVYSSPLKRALDTAKAIARHHQLEVKTDPSLREIDAGELEGLAVTDVGKRLDELLVLESQGEPIFKSYGGESLAELQQRSWGTIQQLVSQHSDEVIVVVSHYFAILAIICSGLNLPLSQIGRLRLVPASISTIVFDEQAARLTLFNDTCHLAAEK